MELAGYSLNYRATLCLMRSILWIRQPGDNALHEQGPVLGVTGTFAMLRESGENQTLENVKTTKKGIILNPQPSEFRRDPLNWPLWKRDAALLVVGWHCFVGGGQTSILAAGMSSLATEFDRSLSQISYLVGAMMLALAAGSALASPTAVLFGKRMVYLVGILIFFCGSIGCAVSRNYQSLLASRIVSGLGVATVESLPSATIAEIYFAHERAYRLGLYTLLLLGGKNLVPLLAAFVFQRLDRHWLFWIVAIIVGIDFFLHLVFVPETFWERAPVPNKRSLRETAVARAQNGAPVDPSVGTDYEKELDPDEEASLRHVVAPVARCDSTKATQNYLYRKSSAISSLRRSSLATGLGFYHGRHSADKWYMVMLRPFVLFCYPAVLFGSFLYALAVVWLIMLSQIVDRVFADEPYNFSSISVGLVYVAPFVGGVLGSISAGSISDRMVRFLAARNGGVYEPEFRLLMVFPAVIASALGLMGFGWCAERGDPWIAPVIFMGVLGYGSSLASTTAITFTVDSYKHFAQESLVTLNVLKNVMGFAFSFFNANFNAEDGYKTTFVVYGCVEIFVGLCAIPLYHFGKRLRSWTDQIGLLNFTYKDKKTSEFAVDSDSDGSENQQR